MPIQGRCLMSSLVGFSPMTGLVSGTPSVERVVRIFFQWVDRVCRKKMYYLSRKIGAKFFAKTTK